MYLSFGADPAQLGHRPRSASTVPIWRRSQRSERWLASPGLPAAPSRHQVNANWSTLHPALVIARWKSPINRRVTSTPPERGRTRPVKCLPRVSRKESRTAESRPPSGLHRHSMRPPTYQLGVFLDNDPQSDVRGGCHVTLCKVPPAAGVRSGS